MIYCIKTLFVALRVCFESRKSLFAEMRKRILALASLSIDLAHTYIVHRMFRIVHKKSYIVYRYSFPTSACFGKRYLVSLILF